MQITHTLMHLAAKVSVGMLLQSNSEIGGHFLPVVLGKQDSDSLGDAME